MKILACKEMSTLECGFVARSENPEEVMSAMEAHMKEKHTNVMAGGNLQDVKAMMMKYMKEE